MWENFQHHIRKFVSVDDQELIQICNYFQLQKVKKKENLLLEGKVCKYTYFVLNGCLRKFFVNEKGVEQTTEFAIENWWMTNNLSFEHKQPSEFFIQAVEPSELLRIDYNNLEKLFHDFPIMDRYFRFIYQRAYASSQMRIKYLYNLSKEEFFHHFNKNYPAFVRRIPQHLVASYLGFSPEYLSEILKKSRS